jgi:hypothetical protein
MRLPCLVLAALAAAAPASAALRQPPEAPAAVLSAFFPFRDPTAARFVPIDTVRSNGSAPAGQSAPSAQAQTARLSVALGVLVDGGPDARALAGGLGAVGALSVGLLLLRRRPGL